MANIAPDLSVFGNIRTVKDFDRLNEEFALKKAAAQAELAKAQQLDLDKLGQQAFVKSSMGAPLTPQESAALNWVDSKQQTMMFDPNTGAIVQRPSLLDRAGIGQSTPSVGDNFRAAMQPTSTGGNGDFLADLAPVGGGLGAPQQPQQNEWDIEAEKQIAAAAGNPKLQQEIRATHAKNKIEMNESQGRAATYADRMVRSEPILTDPNKMAEYGNWWERTKDVINPFGAGLNSTDYQQYKQAQGDFTTAKLRKESGAVINPSEFATDKEIYYPQVGDSPEVLAQKARNRETVIRGMQREAGPAYKAPEPLMVPADNTESPKEPPKKGDIITGSDGDYLFLGGDPAKKSSYKRMK